MRQHKRTSVAHQNIHTEHISYVVKEREKKREKVLNERKLLYMTNDYAPFCTNRKCSYQKCILLQPFYYFVRTSLLIVM